MKTKHISHSELTAARVALVVAIALQGVVWVVTQDHFATLPHLIIIAAELALLVATSFSSLARRSGEGMTHRLLSYALLGVITVANIVSLGLVIGGLIVTGSGVLGHELLLSAIAIFLTNIIIFALWYWEIDSPGLSGRKWSSHDKDFQFTQYDLAHEYRDWQPRFVDYLYLSLTNAINFAPADTRPLTATAKMLMGVQSLISVFTLALVVARSVSILG